MRGSYKSMKLLTVQQLRPWILHAKTPTQTLDPCALHQGFQAFLSVTQKRKDKCRQQLSLSITLECRLSYSSGAFCRPRPADLQLPADSSICVPHLTVGVLGLEMTDTILAFYMGSQNWIQVARLSWRLFPPAEPSP